MEVNLDVLFGRIADEPDERAKIPLLHNAVMAALNRDTTRALAAARDAVQLSELYGDRWSLAMSQLLLGRALTHTAHYIDGLVASEKAYYLFEEQGDRLNAAHALSDTGSALISLSEYTRAFDMLSKGLTIAEELGSDSAIAYSLNRLGYLWNRLGNQSQALLYWQRCLVIVERMGSLELQSTVSNNIANIYVAIGEYGRALEYFERNLTRAVARKDLYRESMSRVNVAEVLQLESRFAEALEHQSRALEIFRTLGHSHFEGIVLSNIGRVLEKSGRLPEALQYQSDAVRLLEQSSDKQDAVRVKLRLGVLYRRIGKYQNGIDLLLEAMKTAIEIASEQLQSKISKQLALSYEQQGNYAAALTEYRNYMKLRHTFLQADKRSTAELMQLRSEVEAASREKEIQRLKNTELAGALEKVKALSAHYRALNLQNTLLTESVTHKLRSPLASISETTLHMHESIAVGHRSVVVRFLGEMEQAARRASRTVDMLLLSHALEAGKFTPEPERFDMAQLAGKIAEDFLDKAVSREVDLQVHAEQPCIVTADLNAVKQILNALVSNAIRYSPKGGVVSIAPAVHGTTAIVRISDDGPGLRRDIAQKLAAAPDSADSVHSFPPGSGLYLARAFAAAIHGTLRYERKKKRTALILEFPAVPHFSAAE